jgi:hypothetical protein
MIIFNISELSIFTIFELYSSKFTVKLVVSCYNSLVNLNKLCWRTDMNQRRVVCAAVCFPDGNMLVGPRHFDFVMLQQFKKFYASCSEENPAPSETDGTMGFLDNDGKFMDRYEALEVAKAANQILHKYDPQNRLFSEDLY